MKAELYQQMREIEDHHWWFRGRRQIVSALLQRIGLSSDSRILDLGCGTGGNLRMLSDYGVVTGVELNQQALELARIRDDANVFQGRLPNDMPFEPQSFDCITMLDVLEHVEEEHAALQTVSGLLAPGGHLLITVPAFKFLWGPHDEEHNHYRRYRSQGLHTSLTEAGFGIDRLTYFNTWLFPPIALVRLIHRWIPMGKTGTEASLPPPFLNRLLLSLFASEQHILIRTRLPFGVSLLALAHKI